MGVKSVNSATPRNGGGQGNTARRIPGFTERERMIEESVLRAAQYRARKEQIQSRSGSRPESVTRGSTIWEPETSHQTPISRQPTQHVNQILVDRQRLNRVEFDLRTTMEELLTWESQIKAIKDDQETIQLRLDDISRQLRSNNRDRDDISKNLSDDSESQVQGNISVEELQKRYEDSNYNANS